MADPQVDLILTYEQLEWRVQQAEKARDAALKQAREAHAETKTLRLILRGMTDEKLSLRITIAPHVLSDDAFQAVQFLLKQYVGQTVCAIEEKLGEPLVRLQDALMHIHYLENHARSRGLPFTPFEVRASDGWLYR